MADAQKVQQAQKEENMSLNPLDWIKSALGVSGEVQTEVAAVETKAEAVAEDGPAKVASVAHAMLETLEEHEAGHPLLLRMLGWLDGLLEKFGEPLMTSIEVKVLTVLAIKYPPLAPVALKVIADLHAKATAPPVVTVTISPPPSAAAPTVESPPAAGS